MIAERRSIREDEIEVIRATLERAGVQAVMASAATSIHGLAVVGRCECGCASVDFDATHSEERSVPVGDGIGKTPRGGQVGVIVWGRADAITGLEIYDLGAGDDDLVLPDPDSIVSWDRAGAG